MEGLDGWRPPFDAAPSWWLFALIVYEEMTGVVELWVRARPSGCGESQILIESVPSHLLREPVARAMANLEPVSTSNGLTAGLAQLATMNRQVIQVTESSCRSLRKDMLNCPSFAGSPSDAQLLSVP